MSYLVLARKWRPQIWEDVVAQDHVTGTLKNAIQHDRLAHAYLFTGPRGVGKTSAARILAKALNCEKGPIPVPCNVCSVCQEIADGRCIDVFEIDGASNRGIDEVRSLRENIKYTPARGKFRIYIIDEIHMLTNEAFNALLKTLEEPPDHVVFIFATTEPRKVPATIISRCQRFDFRRIGIQEIVSSLKNICKEEKIEIDDEALLLIARKADGSLRDSQSILDQMISYTESHIRTEDVIQCLGLIEQEIYFEVTDVLASGSTSDGLSLIDRIVAGGYDLEEFLVGLAEHLRNFLVVRSTDSTDLVEVSESHKKRFIEGAQQFEEEDLLRFIRLVIETRAALKRSINPRIPLELAIVKMIEMDRTVKIEDLLSRLENMGAGGNAPNMVSGNDSPDKQTKQPDQAKTGDTETEEQDSNSQSHTEADQKKNSLTLDDVKSRWDEIIKQVKHKKITVGSFLQEAVIINIDNAILELGFGLNNGFHIDSIMRSKEIVQDVFKSVLGVDLTFKCVKKDLPPKKAVSTKEEKMAQFRELNKDNPELEKLINDLNAEIVE